jgi:hypothetical protein
VPVFEYEDRQGYFLACNQHRRLSRYEIALEASSNLPNFRRSVGDLIYTRAICQGRDLTTVFLPNSLMKPCPSVSPKIWFEINRSVFPLFSPPKS